MIYMEHVSFASPHLQLRVFSPIQKPHFPPIVVEKDLAKRNRNGVYLVLMRLRKLGTSLEH